jgi:hypothetical protein
VVGTIIKRVNKGNPTAIYSVQYFSALKDVIIPHFNQYNLLTQKKRRFTFILFTSRYALR